MIPELKISKEDQQTVENFTFVMREMSWSWERFMNTPVPVFINVLSLLKKEEKERKKHEQKMKARRK